LFSMEEEQPAKWRAQQVRALETIRHCAVPIDAERKCQISNVPASGLIFLFAHACCEGSRWRETCPPRLRTSSHPRTRAR
jgi:hypothetical protein